MKTPVFEGLKNNQGSDEKCQKVANICDLILIEPRLLIQIDKTDIIGENLIFCRICCFLGKISIFIDNLRITVSILIFSFSVDIQC